MKQVDEKSSTPSSLVSNRTSDRFTGYGMWKGWSAQNFFQCSDVQYAYFSGELSGVDLKGKHVLEIGFGNGTFLAFARASGAEVYGTELLDSARLLAQRHGILAVSPDLATLREKYASKIDFIVAFDVLEHLTLEEVIVVLKDAAELLRGGGRLLARFPNGQSPFGRVYQHGDYTHKSTLSASVIGQLLRDTQLELICARNPFRPCVGSLAHRALVRTRNLLQDLLEAAICRIYGFDLPLAPNIVIELKKKDAASLSTAK